MGYRDEDEMSPIGRLLRRLLQERGLRYVELAEGIGLNPSQLSKYAGGMLRPKPEAVEQIIDFLKLTPGEAAELRAAAAERPRPRRRVPSSIERRMGPRHALMRLGDATVREVFRRIREEGEFNVEEPRPDAPVRCDALIANLDEPGRQVGLVFLFEQPIDFEECIRFVKALKVFYDGLEGVLFYRPWLDDEDSFQNEQLREAGGELVYDWNLLAAIARHIPPSASVAAYIRQQEATVRSILGRTRGPR